jgi:hypothetical protein
MINYPLTGANAPLSALLISSRSRENGVPLCVLYTRPCASFCELRALCGPTGTSRGRYASDTFNFEVGETSLFVMLQRGGAVASSGLQSRRSGALLLNWISRPAGAVNGATIPCKSCVSPRTLRAYSARTCLLFPIANTIAGRP